MTQIAVKKCKQCGKEFNLSDSEIDFLRKKGLNIPKRCKECRIKNKKESNISAIEKKLQPPNDKEAITNRYQTIIITLIILLPFITAATAYFTSQSDNKTTTQAVVTSNNVQQNNQTLNIDSETKTEVAIPKPKELPQPKTEAATQQPKTLPQPSKQFNTPVYRKTSNIQITYVLNTYRYKFHRTYCHSVNEMNDRNRAYFYGTRDEIIKMGYKPCNDCRP